MKAKPEDHGISRRSFLAKTGAVTSSAFFAQIAASAAAAESAAQPAAAASVPTHAEVGSLFPFIESQAVKTDFPLSYLNPRFNSVKRWKQRARGKFLDLLQYAPPACPPAAEVV